RDEAREQQSATTEVLRVISSSPGELEPVFQAMLENAVHICDAKFGYLFLCEGDEFRIVAMHSAPAAFVEWWRGGPTIRPGPKTGLARLIQAKEVIQTEDLRAGAAYAERDPLRVAAVELAGARTLVDVPMLKDNVLIGAIVIYRQESQAFTDKQIALVQNFAAQAVIAIENTRLLNELRESLDRQTATADILRVIASTPEDSKHALDTIAETASHMFGVANVNFRRIDSDVLRIVSSAGPTTERLRKALPDIPLEPTDPAVRCFLDNRQIPIEDRQAVLTNERGAIAAALRELPVRSQVFTPLSRQGKAIGVMIVTRGEVQPFQRSDLDLMKGFADQAVIAIENARLLNELRQRTDDLSEALEQQTATSEVLRVISSSPGDLTPVFNAMLENATKICGAEFGLFYLDDGELTRIAAAYNVPPALAATQNVPFRVHPKSGHAESRRTKQIVHIDDIRAMPPFLEGDPRLVALADLGGAR